MKNKSSNYPRLLTLRNLIYLILVGVVLWLVYFFNESKNPVSAELSQIQKLASEYKQQTGNYGIVLDDQDLKNCFAKDTFVRKAEMTTVLSGPDVENISCVFKTASGTPMVEAWSITIVKGERAFCEDSTGDRRETPGLTTSHLCNI